MRNAQIGLPDRGALLIPAPLSAAKADTGKALTLLRTAFEAAGREDCQAAMRPVTQAIERRDFNQLPEHLRLSAFQMATVCAIQLDRKDEGYRYALAATAFEESDDFSWRMRLAYELEAERFDAAVLTVERMAKGRGAALADVPIGWFAQTNNALRRRGDAAMRRRLLTVVASDAYQPTAPGTSTDWLRVQYAQVLLDAGERTTAEGVARSVADPDAVLNLSLDPRFRQLFPGDPDIRARAERALANLRTVSAAHPDHIGPVNQVSAYLRALGRPKEALAALEAIRPALTGTAEVADSDEQAIWWWDNLSRTHQMLGDYPAAAEALQRGAALQENGGNNVSQAINLSELQLKFGQPEAALATLKAFEARRADTSPYGVMQVVDTRGCALHRLGRGADAKRDVDYARAHVDDAPAVLVRLLLCTGDQDGAAAAMIGRLGKDDQRMDALRELSTFDPPVVPPPANPVTAGMDALRAREDVQAAAAKVGGPRRFNVQDVSF